MNLNLNSFYKLQIEIEFKFKFNLQMANPKWKNTIVLTETLGETSSDFAIRVANRQG
jgi:hypothetical protein